MVDPLFGLNKQSKSVGISGNGSFPIALKKTPRIQIQGGDRLVSLVRPAVDTHALCAPGEDCGCQEAGEPWSLKIFTTDSAF